MIRKEDIREDNFVDAAFKVIRRFKNHCGTREQKKALQASLIETLTENGYESFIGKEIEFSTHKIGNSFLFGVPLSRRGPLSKFKGKKIRVVCTEKVGGKSKYMINAIGLTRACPP